MKTIVTFISVLCFVVSSHAQQISKGRLISIPTKVDLQTNLATGKVQLQKFFKADDGSIVSIRQIGNQVYALADRYDRRFSSVWIGQVSGNRLEVKYHYIPKGKAKGSGDLTFKISGSGSTQMLTLETSASNQFNFKSLRRIATLPAKLPIDNRAWYRGNTLNNLTGRWKIQNVGQEYILDSGKQLITYTVGGRKTSHSRPQFATLFIGERNGLNITGNYVDLPYGHTSDIGSTSFKVIGPHFIRANYKHFYHGVNRERIKEDIHEILN
ncbi:hypothetical protein [Spongiivirga citrea]|uniref:Uncharacterized protein n=1 Tax=Spongiivirga citrea TaxID=1481457 RepID=A0A6M0CKJ3_9FLAO|nr:hypothetical protein [Spongiivirga citrea]NER17513.1 hypothetical protein [Spongiivirga citrea]